MSEWREVTLGDVVELKRGYDLPTARRREGSVPVVSSSGPTGFHDEAKVSGPGVVTGRYGTLGKVFYIEEDFWPLNTALYVRDFKGNDPRFVAALLATLDLGRRGGAAAVPGVNRNHLHVLPVTIPDRGTQATIGEVLKALDDLIENNLGRNALLEQMAQAVYREWFVHLRNNGCEDDELVESVLGPIPRGWETKRLGDVGEVTVGGDWGAEEPRGDDWVEVACIRGVDVRSLTTTGETDPAVRWISPRSLEKRSVSEADVIIEGSGDCGNALATSFDLERLLGLPVIYSNFCKRMRFPNRAVAQYVARLLNEMVASRAMMSFVTGTAIPNLNLAGLTSSLDILVPPMTLLERFDDFCAPLDEFRYDGRNRALRNIRDLLLPKLVIGAIDVSKLELDALLDEPIA